MMKKSVFVLMAMALVSTAAHSVEVYNWKGASGAQYYSDIPKDLHAGGVGVVNLRTHTVTQLENKSVGGEVIMSDEERASSIAERQAKLNADIVAENQRIQEENKARAEEQRKTNCTTARMNLQNVESASRIPNREEILARYQADVAKYCN